VFVANIKTNFVSTRVTNRDNLPEIGGASLAVPVRFTRSIKAYFNLTELGGSTTDI
jgi:hypothetical protein